MKLIIGLLIATIGLPLISSAESDDARIKKLEDEIKKLQETNTEILKKLEERPSIPIIRRREPSPSMHEAKPDEIVENYKGHKYKFVPEKRNWHLASKIARQNDGYLVSITDDDENKFVTTLIQKACQKSGELNPRVWIGLNKDNLNNEWQWESGEKYKFSAWGEGEPNNQGNTESSALLNHEALNNPRKIGKWNDGNSEDECYFVIEFEKE